MVKVITLEEQKDRGILTNTANDHAFYNKEYINECFDSIKSGDPLLIRLPYNANLKTGANSTITCLDHILSDVVNTGYTQNRYQASIDPILFDRLEESRPRSEPAVVH